MLRFEMLNKTRLLHHAQQIEHLGVIKDGRELLTQLWLSSGIRSVKTQYEAVNHERERTTVKPGHVCRTPNTLWTYRSTRS